MELLFCGSADGMSSRRVYVTLFLPVPSVSLLSSDFFDPGVPQPANMVTTIAAESNAANNLFFITFPPSFKVLLAHV